MTTLQNAPTYEAAPRATASESPRSGSYSLLGVVRVSDSARYARGLRKLTATVSRVGRVAVLEIETVGRCRTQDERAALLEFAEAYLS